MKTDLKKKQVFSSAGLEVYKGEKNKTSQL
jgi:hypothetical protein